MRPFAQLLASLLGCSLCLASFPQVGRMLPEDTNTVIAIDVGKVMASQIAKDNGWETKWTTAWEAQPIAVPPGTERILTGLRVAPNLSESKWNVSLMELSKPILMNEIARGEAGYADRMWNKVAVTCPAGVIFVQMKPDLLAGLAPADRQAAVRWIQRSESARLANIQSEFIQKVINTAGESAIVMAMDVADSHSPDDIRRAIEVGVLKVDDPAADRDTIAHVLATLQNVRANIDLAATPKATVVAQFGMDAGLMKYYAAGFAYDLLVRAGVEMPEVKTMQATVSGKTVTLQGDLQFTGFRQLMIMASLPTVTVGSQAQAAYSDDPAVVGKASRQYYRTMDAIIQQLPPGSSLANSSTLIVRAAERIERLPVLNVDAELLAWSTNVASRLRQVAVSLRTDIQSSKARQASYLNPTGRYYANWDGSSSDGYVSTASERRNISQQKSQAFAESMADSIKKASDILGGVTQEKADIKAKLTAKYKIEF